MRRIPLSARGFALGFLDLPPPSAISPRRSPNRATRGPERHAYRAARPRLRTCRPRGHREVRQLLPRAMKKAPTPMPMYGILTTVRRRDVPLTTRSRINSVTGAWPKELLPLRYRTLCFSENFGREIGSRWCAARQRKKMRATATESC